VQKPTGIISMIKRNLGLSVWGIQDNIMREVYNQMIRKEYSGKEPVFDLALFESISLDGTRITYELKGKKYFTLVSYYTDDGGHLNKAGKKHIAEQFLIFLSAID
jgi:hypothetical protein